MAVAFLGNAQITLTSADVGAIGSKYFMNIDTNNGAGLVIGPGGTNQAWDFSSVTPGLSDTIEFLDPANTPYAGDFPNANLAIFQSDLNGYAFLTSDNSSLEIIGVAGDPANLGQTFVLPQEDPLRVANFPFSYGDSFQDTSIIDASIEFTAFPPADSARLRTVAHRTLVADGWGDLEFPGATYNTLRVKEISTTWDSVWVHVPFFGWNLLQDTSYTDSTFTWWANGEGYLICEIVYEGGAIDRVTYQNPNQVSVANDPLYSHIVYPNPAQNTLHIQQRSPKPVVMEVYSLTGQLLLQKRQDGRDLEIDTSSLLEGHYILRLSDKHGLPLHSQAISIMR